MEKTIKIMMVALCAHLLYSNSELLIAAKSMSAAGCTVFDKVVLTAFALSYSLISALCVFHIEKFAPVLIFGLLDGFAVYLRINVNQEPFLLITSCFFGFYTFCLVAFCFLISRQNRKQNESKAKNEIVSKKQNEIKTENEKSEFVLTESKTETTVKQFTSFRKTNLKPNNKLCFNGK